MATKKFSPAQIAAQKLFAERARAGTLGKGKRKANPAKKYRFNVTSKTSPRYVAGFFSTKEAAEDYRSSLNSPFNFTITKKEIDPDVVVRKTKATIERDIYGVPSVKRKPNPGLYDNINAKRKRIAAGSGEKMRKPGQAGRPTAKAFEQSAMMTGYQVICMHPKKHVVGIFKTMAEAKLVARAMADAKGVPYGVKAVKVHKTHFAV